MQIRSREERLDPQRVPGLAPLDTETVKKLLKSGRLVHIPQGWTPIRADEPADEAYLVIEGCVEVVDGDRPIADVCRGEFFGEMALVDQSLRNARVTVTDAVLALAWPRADFQKLRATLPDFDELVNATVEARRQ